MPKVAEIGNVQVPATFVRDDVEVAGPRIRHQSKAFGRSPSRTAISRKSEPLPFRHTGVWTPRPRP
jgi:alkanesulfonate monooxygenase SsuD/methylene tetrahydromethanopterin reductase-like flavin-dependent oxidoreductase (luciferase family)